MGQVIDIRTQKVEAQEAAHTKLCVRCRAKKPREEFREDKKLRDGLRTKCRKCESELTNVYQKERRKRWTVRLLQNARTSTSGGGNSKGKRFGWPPVDLTEEYLWELYHYQDGKCAWTGVEMLLECNGMKLQAISLDRLDCSRGYVQGNVVLACRGANLARGNASEDEMRIFVEMIKRS